MPHPTVGVDNLGLGNDFRNGKIDVMSIAYSDCDATIPSKCTVNLAKTLGITVNFCPDALTKIVV